MSRHDNPNSDWYIPDTPKQKRYVENAKSTGNISTNENWGQSNGRLMDVKVGLSGEQIQHLQEKAWKAGISIEKYLQKLIEEDS